MVSLVNNNLTSKLSEAYSPPNLVIIPNIPPKVITQSELANKLDLGLNYKIISTLKESLEI
jgi:hypothetical protein